MEKLPGEVELSQTQKRSVHAKDTVALGQRDRWVEAECRAVEQSTGECSSKARGAGRGRTRKNEGAVDRCHMHG